MKKITSIILTLVMILSLVPVVISAAPEGQGIASLSEITDMAGKYYLTADTTVDATIADEFTGTLDGNGKTITVNVAMFTKVNNATIGNFKVKGDIKNPTDCYLIADTHEYDFYAAVAIIANGTTKFHDIVSDVNFTDDVDGVELAANKHRNTRYGAIAAFAEPGYDLTFENITTNGKVTVKQYAGGIFGWSAKQGTAKFVNCTNNGDILCNGLEGKLYVGGILCRLSGEDTTTVSLLTFENCKNTGDVTSTSTEGGYCGGIMGFSTAYITATNCVNSGNVTGEKYAGGIFGSLGDAKHNGNHTVKYCVNTGNISTTSNAAGGIIGYANAGGSRWVDIQGCINTGKISGNSYLSQILTYTNSAKTVIKNNLALGSLEATGDSAVMAFVSGSSADLTAYTIEGNYIKGDDGTKYLTYTASSGKEANIIEYANRAEGTVINATDAQLASGEVAFKLNTALGENAFRQTLGTDAVPNLDPANKIVVGEKDGYANEAPKPVDPPKPTPTGDATVAILFALMAVSAGAVLTLKKKTR